MERILIVDDDEVGRVVLSELLSDRYEIDLAVDGEEAIAKFKSGVEYSRVLLDLMMPKVDGFGVMDYLREAGKLPALPVIVLTSDDHQETREKCLAAGAKTFLRKPFRFDEIIASLA